MPNLFRFCGKASIIVVRLTFILGFTKSTLAGHNMPPHNSLTFYLL
jgi:hypothetical protein